MLAHDIIDNRNERLVDHINQMLSSTDGARFAVGYFFLSGFTSIAGKLAGVKELRLLIGNTTNRETLEQLAEGYRRLDLVAEAAEAEKYPKRTETKRMAEGAAHNVRTAIELMDQSDEKEELVNYDPHWNPVRLIQRFGRIDRIGSEHEIIYGFNFLPETGIEKNLKLTEKLHLRIQEIHDTIGEDSAIPDSSEQLNEEAMYAIYEKKAGKTGQLSFFEDEGDDFLDLNEAEEILRQMRKENPDEYERIADLRDGIRTARPSDTNGLFVFCQAGRYQQLFFLDEKGDVVSRDISRILGTIKCGKELAALELPKGYNATVMGALSRFRQEVRHRQSELEHTFSLSHGQRYVMRELRSLFGATDDQDEKARINVLERTFRSAIPKAVDKELNKIRRNSITGENLLKKLGELYNAYSMRDWLDKKSNRFEDQAIPKIVCSEGLARI